MENLEIINLKMRKGNIKKVFHKPFGSSFALFASRLGAGFLSSTQAFRLHKTKANARTWHLISKCVFTRGDLF